MFRGIMVRRGSEWVFNYFRVNKMLTRTGKNAAASEEVLIDKIVSIYRLRFGEI